MGIRWTVEAAVDLEEITDHIAEDNPDAALGVARKIFEGVESLSKWPHRGRAGSVEGTRELVFAPLPYVAVYRVGEACVEVLHIY